MTVIEAPTRTRGRGEATILTQGLGDSLESHDIVVVFEKGALATTSFIDELVRAILVDRRAASLTLTDLPAHLDVVATDAATYYGVAEQLTLSRS